MSRNPAGVKKRGRKRPVEQVDLPIQRNALRGVVADVAGVGERLQTVMNLLLDAKSCVPAKKRVQEAASLAHARLKVPTFEAVLDSSLHADSPANARHQDATTSEPALDVRIAGACAANEGEHEDSQADEHDMHLATQVDWALNDTKGVKEGDSVLRLQHVDSHELLYIARLLREDPHFHRLSLLINQPLGCETRRAALMASLMVLLSSLQTCPSLSTIDITMQVPAEERRQSAARNCRDARALPQVVIREVRQVASGCTWLKRCRFEVLGVPRCTADDTRDAEWKQQRREEVRPIRTAILMGHHPRCKAAPF